MSKLLKRFSLLFLTIVLSLFAITANAANSNVTNMQELKDAIARGDSITINNDINITETLNLPATYQGEIKSDGKKLTLNAGVENMFVVPNDAEVKFNNIIFDGQNNGRIIDAGKSKVTIIDSTLKNATTENNTERFEGGAIYAFQTTLELENTTFENNHTKKVVPSPGAPHGGAIVSYSANITITGGKFNNNHTGKVDKENASHGEGGAIKLHPGSTLTINDSSTTKKDTTVFDGNHLDSIETKGGRQGGAIEATESKVHIYGTTFKIPGPFNTGGAIKFEGSEEAVVKNCHFETLENKGTIGVAGGAITSQNSKLTIDSSTFKANGGSRVSEAGGLIHVVGGGIFNLKNSSLEGSGAWWNGGRYTANTGGAINFYDDATVTAKIENTTIKNFMVDGAGAGISVAKSAGHEAAVKLTMTDTTIENTAAYVWQGTAHGGAMFVGKGNTITINGGKISSQTASNNAGGIFNEGSVTITGSDKGPAQITGNSAYQMVGGIYNDGYLKVDKANFSGNKKGDDYTGDGHILSKTEMGGINIYADKDVIITPNAKFDGNDIRVLDGQSQILLTGALENQLNVSISEAPKTTKETNILSRYTEDQQRYIGYKVASGTDNYTATPEDAKKIHYVSKDTSQPIAAVDDHTSIGKWDYVFDPDNKSVVLGQRAKMVYHANYDLKNAKFNDGTKEKEQFYTFYSTSNGKPKVSIDNVQAKQMTELGENPISKWIFDGWYNHKPIQPIIDNSPEIFQNTKKPDVSDLKVDFEKAYFTNSEGKITKIIAPNELHVYAGWKSLEITVNKVWDDEGESNQANQATLIITPGKDGKNQESFTADRKTLSYTFTFTELDKFEEDGITPVQYSIDEPNVPEGYTKSIAQSDNNDTISATVTNTKGASYKVVHEFKAADDVTVALPQAIIDWTPADQLNIPNGTEVTPSDFVNKEYDDTVNDGKWKFISWDKQTDTIKGADVKFVGTWSFTKKVETGSVYVKYITEDGKVLEAESAVKKDAPVGEEYTTQQKTFDGYVFSKMAEDSAPAKGTVIKGELHVTYVYKAKETPEVPDKTNVPNIEGKYNVPQTGEDDSLLWYTLMMIVSGITLLAIVYKRKKANK